MIRVLYDDQGFFGRYSGVARYFTEVMKRLPEGFQYKIPLASSDNIVLQRPPFNLPPHRQDVNDFVQKFCFGKYFPGVGRVYRLCAQLMPKYFPSGEWANIKNVRRALAEGDFDVFHMTGAHWVRDDWKIVAGKKPIVVTVHDLIPELLFDSKRTRRCREKVLAAAAHVITVSEYTKRDLMQMYGVPEEKITVIYHGYIAPASTGVKMQLPVEKPYVLYVGKRSGYKNFNWFVKAIAPVLKSCPDLHLFCTGMPFSSGEISMIEGMGIRDRVFQAFVPDEEMPSLFANAEVFVYPSLYEGFGIPILDAFAARCPVLLSNASCFPEVGGDAALYFNPNDEGDFREKIAILIGNNQGGIGIRKQMIERGISRLKNFSWDKCVKETTDVYCHLVQG